MPHTEEKIRDYEVKLPVFEGPLDLLVYLVYKNELDPRLVPIAVITNQYLEYIKQIGVDNLNHAGSFLVMASRLMYLKALELLPEDEKEEADELEYDLDRETLIQQMLEHQKFKEAAKYLQHLEMRGWGTYGRGRKDRPDREESQLEEFTDEAGIYDLLTAFHQVIKSNKTVKIHDVEIDDVTIENQIKKIQDYIAVNSKCHFDDLFRDDPRQIAIVVLFMSLLELGKIGALRTYQYKLFSPIWIYRKDVFSTNHPRHAKLDAQGWEDLYLKSGLVELLQAQIREKQEENSLDEILKEMEAVHVLDLDTVKPNYNNEQR